MSSLPTEQDDGSTGRPPGKSPPASIPGYELREFLGSGAYGQVWVGVDENTGRQVAIKFVDHRQSMNWSLLSREVEKLVFLSTDRYVVQLLDVGWDAEPPYFVMEYVESGSLNDRLHREGTYAVQDAVDVFRDMAIGLSHAHGKGVLHCDLKPANILLDVDGRPRLADFGQSRLTGEQNSALGTLFYMAPEQADLRAVPDATWDVYGLGTLLYTMLVGQPPYRTPDAISYIDSAGTLEQRLERYRKHIIQAPTPSAHRQIPGVDRALADIIDRCIAANPKKRYPHVIGVIDALDRRATVQARRPLWVLGILGPLLLLLTMSVFGYRGYQRAIGDSKEVALQEASETNRFAAIAVAKNVANELDRRFNLVTEAAAEPELHKFISDLHEIEGVTEILNRLSEPGFDDERERDLFVTLPERVALQAHVDHLLRGGEQPPAASWFVTDTAGTHLASSFVEHPSESPIGHNYAWRTYFHGGPVDLDDSARPAKHITAPHLSAVFRSRATYTWKTAVSAPIVSSEGKTLGIVALTVELGRFVSLGDSETQRNVVVDGREGPHQGVVLEHPLFNAILAREKKLPEHFYRYRVDVDQLRTGYDRDYIDPVSEDPLGAEYSGAWILGAAPVEIVHEKNKGTTKVDTGLWLIVQERANVATESVDTLASRLVREALAAFTVVTVVSLSLGYFLFRRLRESKMARVSDRGSLAEESTIHSRDTLEQPQRARGLGKNRGR